jgi:sialate O-acetylesterase
MFSHLTHPALVLMILLAGMPPAFAEIKLARVFSEHMVLQRDKPVPVWGWGEPGEAVTVTLGSQSRSTMTNSVGRWRVTFDKLSVSEDPLTLTACGKNMLTVNDILIGEVWLCSGQSNMAMTVNRARDFETEKKSADLPRIRMFTVKSGPATKIQDDCAGDWEVCHPDSVGGFSATGYFFGRELHQVLDVPIGLINSSVGGTGIEAWTSLDVQEACPELVPLFKSWDERTTSYNPETGKARYERQLANWKEEAKKARSEGRDAPRRPVEPVNPREDRNHPANLFNGKIAPLIPFALRGAIWYQGEHNARTIETAELYRLQLPLLIEDWRDRWSQGEFPFAWAQLPNFKKTTVEPQVASEWAVMRESMARALSVPHTGMAVTIDVGEANDIHPKNKQDVGKRLSLWALAKVYQQDIVSSGPVYASHKIEESRVILRFQHVAGGLITEGGQPLVGFAIAGEDKRWHWANAEIVGETVVVALPSVPKPLAVRYAWGDNPKCNLHNTWNLPAAPFRTDDWPHPAAGETR